MDLLSGTPLVLLWPFSLPHLQESNVAKASNDNGAVYVLEFEYTVILATIARYIQKTTSPIHLVFKAVTTLSKIVCLDSETCLESNLNSATKCLGFCEIRRYVSFETDSRVIAEYFLSLEFGSSDDEHY